MKLSALPYTTVNYEEESSFLAWFDYAAEIGLDGVEVMYYWPMNWHVLYRTRKRIGERKLAVSMVTTHCNPALYTDDLRKAEVKKLEGYVDLAADCGCRHVRVIGGRHDPTWCEVSTAKALDAVVKTFEMALPHAEKSGVIFALENHPGFGVTLDVVRAILQRLPSRNFGWNFDMENAYRVAGQTAFDFLNDPAVLSRLTHVHAKNFLEAPDGWNTDVALDEGMNDVRAMVAAIKAHGYDDWISIEFGGKTRDKVRRSAEFLRQTWREV